MGFGRVVWSGIVGMLCLIPMAWISFSLLDLTESITGGLVDNFNIFLGGLGGALGLPPGISILISVLGGAIIGLALLFLFPIHWCLFYRPDDVLLIISVILPWILACSITAAISAHSPRGGIHTSLAIGIGYMIPTLLIYFVLRFIPVVGPMIQGIIDGLTSGLTDLPYALAVFTSILEGCLVGAVFGGFIGVLKYKPEGGTGKAPRVKKSKGKVEELAEPTIGGSDFCTNCGSKIAPGDDFCSNCGQKFP